MTNRANRLLWTVIGLALLAGGVAGLLVGQDWLPGTDPRAPLLWPALRGWWREIDPWGLVGIVLLGVAVAVLGLILLLAELRRQGAPALRELRLPAGPGGRTRVPGPVIGHGLARDLARDPAIRGAAVAVTGTAARPELWIRLDLVEPADLAQVRQRVEAGALARFARTYGLRPGKLDVTARLVGDPPARVR